MIIRASEGELVFDQAGCRGVKRYEAAGNEYVQLEIDPGCEIPPHPMPIAVSFYVLSGRGICLANGESVQVEKGDMIECLPDTLRGWKNEETEVLEFLAIKRMAE